MDPVQLDQAQDSQQSLNLGHIAKPMLIFGGPYSNLQATQAMQHKAVELDVPPQNVICTGDIVAYCAEPEATTSLIRQWGIKVVMGNCEESLAEGALDCGCGFEEDSACSLLSTGWYSFARTKVSDEHKQWMGSLPRSIHFEMADKKFQVIHGGVDQINRFLFAGSDTQRFNDEFAKTSADVVIGGHCGIPFHKEIGNKHWINAGVIGMPANDGTDTTWYLLLEPDTASGQINVSWHRLKYDVSAARNAMEDAGLITPYRQALADGLWPSMDVLPEAEKAQQGRELRLEKLAL
ncbi:metallophosphoesterase family protein [Oceanospirillum sanctuarii]|uniref:metallophosphoesterase family protein n=1 Tax=Oceanospirillum sanctuarii TaxID=1434821 RepID=UPI000A3687F7|nr:metallophosphoesterase family protein [Oceanospirillum sanctuarii]